MSRFFSFHTTSPQHPVWPALLLILLLAPPAAAQPLVSLKMPNGSPLPIYPGDTVNLPIRVENATPGFASGGFNLFFQYDTTALRLLSAAPGSLLTDCAWELFAWRPADPGDCDGAPCPGGLIHITVLADYVIPIGEPLCWELSNGELIVLTFAVNDNPIIADSSYPIRWFWYGCTDNEFASKNGDSVHQSRSVFDENLIDVTADLPFPTTTGAPRSCLTSPTVLRTIDYHHGSIAIAPDPLQEPVRLRLSPRPLYAFQANALNPVPCTLYLGNLAECSLDDIDPASIRLNDTISPLATTMVPPPAGFYGEVLAATFDARSLICPLIPIYDTITTPVTVTWHATAGCVQNGTTEVIVVGHRSGDVNNDGSIDIRDVTLLIAAVFRGVVIDLSAADVNGSGAVNVADISTLIRHLFR